MAQRTVITDDLDGKDDATTVYFAFDDAPYEIDLSDKNREGLAAALAKYISNARPDQRRIPSVRPRGAASARRSAASGTRGARGERNAEIRDWAKAAGKPVNERGRIPADLIAEYDSAHPAGTTAPTSTPAPTGQVKATALPPESASTGSKVASSV